MTAREAASTFRKNQWIGIIHDMRQSGLTVREYCRCHNLSRNAYFYWLRKIREDVANGPEPQIVALPSFPLVEATDDSGSQERTSAVPDDTEISIEFKGARISFRGALSRELFSSICEAVSDAE